MTIDSSTAGKSKDIPKPSFPSPRRRSSVAQAAAANQDPAPEATMLDRMPLAAGEGRADQAADETSHEVRPAPPSLPAEQVATPAVPQPPARERGRTRGVSAPRPAPAAAQAPKRPAASKDILLSLPEDAKERMVNTITWTQPHTGIGQQQKFIRKAISDLCDRLERDFNNGEPFPAPARIEE